MANRKQGGLNRGLEHLLGDLGKDVIERPQVEALRQIHVDKIQPGRYQPRKSFDNDALNELALSITEHGILQPLVVRPIAQDCYEIIAGERRFRAGKQAGLIELPCVIKNYTDKQALAVALIENLQRSDLNVLEVARGLQQLVEDFSLTHERVAQLIGRSRSAVSNILRLLDLSEPVKAALTEDKIEMGHARAMLSLSAQAQEMLLAQIIKKHMTVRQTEAYVRGLLSGSSAASANLENDNVHDLARRLTAFLGHTVLIQHKKKGNGKLVLKYKNLDDLEKILQKWGVS